MSFDLQKLNLSHEDLLQQIQKYDTHLDFKTRLILISETKKLLAVYFKQSIPLGEILTQQSKTTHSLSNTVLHYTKEIHKEGKRIILLIQKYDASSNDSQRFKFQMDMGEALSLLKHRIEIEKKYFIPEYKRIQKK